jgi:hypothetical protein
MTIPELKELKASGEFHHATYRNIGTLHEGLYIYRRSADGFHGYKLAGAFNKMLDGQKLIDEAYTLVRETGVSVGSFGRG